MPGNERLEREERFHNSWAAAAETESIDVIRLNEAETAPEIRYICERLGALAGKSVLDIGCGLGEASIYFALKGAKVTGVDLSEQMLSATQMLAKRYNVYVETVHCSAESLCLPPKASYDIVYAANLFHHVDIAETLARISPHLKKDGILASWDPVAYNPLINLYRRIATKVRTVDEHPLRLSDIRIFRQFFGSVEYRYFWLTTLTIFIIMTVFQRRNPNRERFWKKVVEESARWAPLYRPLKKLDDLLLTWLPFLRPLCWNVVILAREPFSRRSWTVPAETHSPRPSLL